ncbi:MAG TPA: glycosyltransferase family 4 protein [Allosphingosinicella sp.]|jgi:hypothetical protein
MPAPGRPLRVLALTRYDLKAASTRQRFAQYFPYLADHGVEVTLAPLLPDSYLDALNEGRKPPRGVIPRAYRARLRTLREAGAHDLLWVQYELLPYWPGFAEAWAARTPRPIVCDYDDAIFHGYDRHRRWVVRKLLGRKLEPLLSRAAAAMCGNAYLQHYARRFCSNSVIVPTVVDTDAYQPATASRHAPLTVGWLGSPTTWVNVEPLLPALLPVLRARGARLRIIGAGPPARGIEGIEAVDWSEADEIGELQAMDVGIMPLLDQPFQRGKCGYKLIQYMACGVPTVASPVGVNAEIVADGSSGFLAAGPAEWAARLDTLLADAPLRARMGVEGRRIAVERYSLASQQPRVLSILRAAAG